MSNVQICCICGQQFHEFGNNPYPVKEEGRCCDACNHLVVVPARLAASLKQMEREDA